MSQFEFMSAADTKLSTSQILSFASVGIPLAAVGLPIAVFVAPMYAEQLGLGTTLTGLIFMCLRFWDLASDPVMGWLVDTRPTPKGRVKHWLICSVPVLMLGAWFIYMPTGDSVSPAYLVVWLAVFWLGFTMLQTPHQSWVPMITTAYDQRSRLFLWREIFSTATLLSLLIIPTVLASQLGMERRGQVAVMGYILMIVLPVTVYFAVRNVPDTPPPPDAVKLHYTRQTLKETFRDHLLLRIMAVEVLVGIAIAGTGGMFLFVAQWGFGVIDLAPVILLVFFIAGFTAMPFWIWLSKRLEKHTAFMLVCSWSVVTYLVYLPMSQLNVGLLGLSFAAVVSGLGYGTPFILARSMIADVIENAELRYGESRAGLYYSMMSGSYKTGASFAIGIPYILLGAWIGFDPSGENGPDVVDGLVYVFVGVPVAAYALCVLLLRGYPLTRSQQHQNATQIEARKTLPQASVSASEVS